MADNVEITAGSGTTVATDDVGAGVQVQRVKATWGPDGTANDADVASGKPLPVQIRDSDGTARSLVLPAALAANGGLKVEGVAGGVAVPVSLATLPALVAGSANIGDVDVLTLPALPAGSNNIGDVDVLTVPEHAGAAASTINSTSSDGGTALTNSAQAIKASAGKLLGYFIYNPNAVAAFVQFYNTASGSVTVGTTNPLFMLTIPPASAANLWMQPGGITFGTAMSWAATSTAGGNGAPTTALDAVAWYV